MLNVDGSKQHIVLTLLNSYQLFPLNQSTPQTTTTMNPKLTLLALATSGLTANAAVMTLYSGPGCTGDTQSVNVWDNTCATAISGFQSFEITSGGGGGQQISTYSPNSCAGGYYTCVSAGDVGTCYNSFGVNFSGSNAISSSPVCGAV